MGLNGIPYPPGYPLDNTALRVIDHLMELSLQFLGKPVLKVVEPPWNLGLNSVSHLPGYPLDNTALRVIDQRAQLCFDLGHQLFLLRAQPLVDIVF